MKEKKNILVADDHSIVRMGLVQILREFSPHLEVTEISDYKSLFDIIHTKSFDLFILDVNMPNGNFSDAIHLIKLKLPESKILVFSSYDEELYALRYLKMGADGFLNKLSSREKIIHAIKTMLKEGRYFSKDIKEKLVLQSLENKPEMDVDSLSDRELSVAQLLIKGKSQKEISQELNLHSSTVSTYKSRVFEKLNIKSIPELIDILKMATP